MNTDEDGQSANGLTTLDLFIFGSYFVVVVCTGFLSMCVTGRGTIKEFFLAGHHMSWLPIGASLFASNIGSEHFIGLAGSGAASGIGIGAFELNACILLQLLGWIFLPVYIANGVITLPQYLGKRFGGQRIQVYLAVLSLILYIFTKISVNLYSGAIFIKIALNWNVWVSILLLLGLTALVTMTGGLTAVIYTDTVQAVIMLVGSTLLTIIGLEKVGGPSGLMQQYATAVANGTSANSSCARPSQFSFRLLRPIDDVDMPWLGFLLGQTPASIWYWCADQIIVQRALAAKSLAHAQGGTLLAGYLKLTPLFIMVIPGMISRILHPDIVACANPDACEAICGSRAGCSNLAFPQLVVSVMPMGLRGLLMAVMVSALVTDLTSIFNSASTLFTLDVYLKIRRAASAKEQLLVGRASVAVLVALSIAWIPIISTLQGSQLLIYIQDVVANLAPPIASVYLAAVLWRGANEPAAFYSLLWGFVIGFLRLIVTSTFPAPACGDPDTRPPWIHILPHYMYFALFSALSSLILLITISCFTGPPDEAKIRNLTIFTIQHPDSADDDPEATVEGTEMVEHPPSTSTSQAAGFGDGKLQQVQQRHHYRRLVSRAHHWIQHTWGWDAIAAHETPTSCLRSVQRSPRQRTVLTTFLCIILLAATALYVTLSTLPPLLI